jgi:hypothetical protein
LKIGGGGGRRYTPAEADFIFSQFFGGGNPFGGSFGRGGRGGGMFYFYFSINFCFFSFSLFFFFQT